MIDYLTFNQSVKLIQDTLEILRSIDEPFTDYFIQQVVNILRLNHLNPESIESCLNPDKYIYNPYQEIPLEINENTQVQDIVKLYLYEFNKKLSDGRLKDQTKKEIKAKKKEFNNKTKEINTLLKYNTITPEEIQTIETIKNQDSSYNVKNIQFSINSILNNPRTVNIRLTYLIKTGFNKFNNNKYRQQLMKLFKMKYELFVVDSKNRRGMYESTYYHVPKVPNGFELKSLPYQEVNRQWLLEKITSELENIDSLTVNDMFITLKDCEKMLEYVNDSRYFNENIVELENVFINRKTMNIITKTEDNFKDYLTSDRLGIYEDNGSNTETIHLFKYDPDITVKDLTPENTSETVRIMKEILIPRQEPEKQEIFLYFIQLLGLMVHGNNDIKILPVFYRQGGNNGKGVLSIIIKALFGNGANDIKKSRINDDFINEVITKTKHSLINDELDPDTIKNNSSEYKQLSGASGMGGRRIQSHEVDTIKEIPPLFLASNYVPEISITNENLALIKRLNLIKMPNVFVEEANPNKNEYEVVTGTDNIIRKDFEGLSQVISLAINEFKKLDYSGNVRSQLALTPTVQETMYLISASNPLINYITLYTTPMELSTPKTSWISTSMIKEAFTEWYKSNNNGLEPPNSLFGKNNVKIGYALQSVYGQENVEKRKEKPSHVNVYCFKLLSEEDKEFKEKQLIEIHDYDPDNKHHKALNPETKSIYGLIKNNNLTNEEDIISKIQQSGYTSTEIIEHLKVLDNVDLIEYKQQRTL